MGCETSPPRRGRGSFFGSAVAIHGNAAIVGAYGDDEHGYFSGAAYVFEQRDKEQSEEWIERAALVPSDGAPYLVFGASAAIYGDIAVVGAPSVSGSERSGAVYVFVRNDGESWTEEAKFTAGDDAVNGDDFGLSLGVYDDRCYVFVRSVHDVGPTSTWKKEVTLVAADGNGEDDRFGWSVGIHDNTVVVGADLDDGNGSTRGLAYIFVREEATSVWRHFAKLLPSDGIFHDRFGYSVAIYDDIAVVGAINSFEKGGADHDSVSAFVYTRDRESGSWTQQAIPPTTDGTKYYNSRCEVAVYNNTVIVGSSNHRNNGAVLLFTRVTENGTWSEQPPLLPIDQADDANFGVNVGVYGNTVIVGANHDDINGEKSGSVYLYSLSRSTLSPRGNNGLHAFDDVELDTVSSKNYNNSYHGASNIENVDDKIDFSPIDHNQI